MKTGFILTIISTGLLAAGGGPSDADMDKLKLANTKVWLNLLKNPDAHLIDWKSVDLKVLAEMVDALNGEIQNPERDPWKLDAKAVEVLNQIRLVNRRNYTVTLDKPDPVRYQKHYFSSRD